MPEIGRVGGPTQSPGQNDEAEQPQDALVKEARMQTTQASPSSLVTEERRGEMGQPLGMPAPPATGQTKLMPDAIAGRDPSQLIAAEQLRITGGASATEELLGLNRQPSIPGAFAPPPGNHEALRHMTPASRRTVMRSLLDHQRQRVRQLAYLLRRERDERRESESDGGEYEEAQRETQRDELPLVDEAQLARARVELGHAAQMLDLLEELMRMQDYSLSQMGAASQG